MKALEVGGMPRKMKLSLTQPISLPTLPVARIAALPWLTISYAAVALWFVACKIIALIGAVPVVPYDAAQSTPEIAGYFTVAHESLLSASFWAASRPVGYPLFCKLLACNPAAITVVQTLVSIACWSTLAYAVTRTIRTPDLRPIAAWFVLAFSLTSYVTQWDAVTMTESLSLSLFALLLALVLLIIEAPSVRLVMALCVAATAWVALRDTHAFSLLFCVPLLFVVGFKARHWWTVAAVVVVVSGLSLASASKGQRERFSLYNNIGRRVLMDESATQYFMRAGMPVNDAVRKYINGFASSNDFYVYRAPEMAAFRHWVGAKGKGTYAKWLLSDPRRLVTESIVVHAPYTVTPSTFANTPNGMRAPLPHWAAESLYSKWPRDVATAVAVALLAALLLIRRRRGAWLLPLALITTAPLLSILCYWGDAMEPARHCLEAGVQLQLGMWLLLLLCADALKPTLSRRASEPEPQSVRRLVRPALRLLNLPVAVLLWRRQ